jgi:hypothetical protein
MPSMKEALKIAVIAVVAVAIAKKIPFTASYL